ncbi:MAG: hypothetical protein FWF58_05330, partial [Firmicutes bacterium]|nr:hypothetical protein [Bacillota bacterium]
CNNLFSFLITDWVWFNEILVYLFSQGWFVVVAIFLFISGAFSIIQISKLAKKYGNHNSELPLQISTIPSIHGNSVASLVYSLTIAICILFWVSAFVLAMS